jgi:glycerol kinase
MLYNIQDGSWDKRLLDRLQIPEELLAGVRDSQGTFGETAIEHFGAALPITGVLGDQQAAAFGQACFSPGALKATYGTGCFVVANSGDTKVQSASRMLATILHQREGRRTYALEGAIFMAGATVQWLRDGLGVIDSAEQSEELARRSDPDSGVYLVPAFQGLGAPFWDSGARAAILGMTRASTKADIVAAGLEAVAFQTRDLLEAMAKDMAVSGLPAPETVRADGGMTANRWFMQRLADILQKPVESASMAETTALGAAYIAGQAIGFYGDDTELAAHRASVTTFLPEMSASESAERHAGWLQAVSKVRSEVQG